MLPGHVQFCKSYDLSIRFQGFFLFWEYRYMANMNDVFSSFELGCMPLAEKTSILIIKDVTNSVRE